jgi:alkylation response protein AidB-like acyl-CoA dehydrogenase
MPRNIYDEDHETFRDSVREFCQRVLLPRTEEMLERKVIDRDLWLEAGKMGFLGLEIPEEYGGAGAGDYRFNAIGAEEWSRVNAAVSSCFGIHSDVCPPYIVDLGTQEQKQRWLPGMASGELICGIAMTEPGGGSDLAALRTTAVRDGDWAPGEEGDWILNGSKTFITNGYQADLVIVAARTDPSKGAKGSPSSWWRPGCRASPGAANSTRSARRSPTPPNSSSTTSDSPTRSGSGKRAVGSSR